MLKLTIQLFFKALVIGIVVNLALLYAAELSDSAQADAMFPIKYQSLEQPSTGSDLSGNFGN